MRPAHRNTVRSLAAALACLLAAGAAGPLLAQDYSAQLGISSFDLAGTGTGLVAVPSYRYRIGGVFAVRASLPLFLDSRTRTVSGITFAESDNLLLPEVSVEAGWRLGPLQPFVGVGAGVAANLAGRHPGGATLHAALGAAIPLRDRVRLAATGKVRAVRPWSGSMVDLTIGLEFDRSTPPPD